MSRTGTPIFSGQRMADRDSTMRPKVAAAAPGYR
jgi:hypothetical protein